MHTIWGHGHLLAFSGIDGPTDYAGGLTLRTVGPGTAIMVALPGTAMISIDLKPPTSCVLGGDHFDFGFGDGRRVRGAMLDAWHFVIEGPVAVTGNDGRLTVVQRGERTLIASAQHVCEAFLTADVTAAIAARRHWVTTMLPGRSNRGPAVAKALSQVKTMVYGPEGIFRRRWTTPDRWPHRGCWLWDSAFHAIGMRHLDIGLARDVLTAVLDGQRPDGRVVLRMDPDGKCHPEFTQPPTLVLSVWCLEQTTSDPAWIAEIADRLEAYLDWDRMHRDVGHGLPHWSIEGGLNCRSGESGLDNSSRFDAATDMEAVDFSSFLALEYELLGRLHQRDGRLVAAERCAGRAATLRRLISERLWDATSGVFRDKNADGSWCPVVAVTAYLPLICGAASPEQARRLAELLQDPRQFGTKVLLPSVARGDASYDHDMWRGPVWANMVWLAAAGFDRYGMSEIAARLRMSITSEIERWYGTHGTLFEYYDAEGSIAPDKLKRKGQLAPEVSYYNQCFHDYGWTATLYLDMVLAAKAPLPVLVQN